MGLGEVLSAQGDFAGAVANFHKATKINPQFAEAHNGLGNALSAQRDFVGAAASFRKAAICFATVTARPGMVSAWRGPT